MRLGPKSPQLLFVFGCWLLSRCGSSSSARGYLAHGRSALDTETNKNQSSSRGLTQDSLNSAYQANISSIDGSDLGNNITIMHYHQHLQAHNKRTRPLYRLVNCCFLGYTCPPWRFAESSCRIGIAAVRPGDLYIIVDGPENRRILVESKCNNNIGRRSVPAGRR